MEEINYSLCIYKASHKSPSQLLIRRICDLDIDKKEFFPVNFQDSDDPMWKNNPKIIGVSYDLNLNDKVEVRSWNAKNDDPTKYVSTHYDYKVYEVVFLNEFSSFSIDADGELIRKNLYDGINLPKNLTDNFLIIIGSNNTSMTALLCNINDFVFRQDKYIIPETPNDILHETHFFPKVFIRDSDLLNTDNLNISSLQTRYFFKSDLDSDDFDKFHLRPFEKYIPIIINRYLKKRSDFRFSKTEINKLTEAIKLYIDTTDELNEIASIIGCSTEQVGNTFESYKDYLVNSLLGNNDVDRIIENIFSNSPEIHDVLVAEAKKRWLTETDVERNKLLSDLDSFKLSLDRLRGEEQAQIKKRDLLIKRIESLENDEKIKSQKLIELEKDTREELRIFESNLARLVAICKISSIQQEDKLISEGFNSQDLPIIRDLNGPVTSSISEINTKDEFLQDLTDNFSSLGVKTEYSYYLSNIIYSAISLKIGIVFIGGQTRLLAHAIAALIDEGKLSCVIMPTGFSNIDSLFKKINNLENKVVLFENPLDCLTESLCNSLIENCPDKTIILDIEHSQLSGILSTSIWKNYVVVNQDFLLSVPTGSNLCFGKTNKSIFINQVDYKEANIQHKKFAVVAKHLGIQISISIKISLLLSHLIINYERAINDHKYEAIRLAMLLVLSCNCIFNEEHFFNEFANQYNQQFAAELRKYILES